jgi:hypothetical protein
MKYFHVAQKIPHFLLYNKYINFLLQTTTVEILFSKTIASDVQNVIHKCCCFPMPPHVRHGLSGLPPGCG